MIIKTNKGNDLNKEIMIFSPYLYIAEKENQKMLYDSVNQQYHKLDQNIKQLYRCLKRKVTYQELCEKFPLEYIQDCIDKKIAFNITEAFHVCQLKYVEIEINTACNNACVFCPSANKKTKNKSMKIDLFQSIIDQLLIDTSCKHIAFNFYNEPLLDFNLWEKMDYLLATGIKLTLYTNARLLDRNNVQRLKGYLKCIESINVNLPSCNPDEYFEYTQRSLGETIQYIKMASDGGLPIKINVQGEMHSKNSQLQHVKDVFRSEKIEITAGYTTDRAGNLNNEYCCNVHIKNQLAGCPGVLHTAVIKYNGDVGLCCNDFKGSVSYGNLSDASLMDLFHRRQAIHIRRQIYGDEKSHQGFICRKCIFMKQSQIERAKLLREIG